MLIDKMLSSIAFALCIVPVLSHAALVPIVCSVGQIHEACWAKKKEENGETKVREYDKEILKREKFQFDKQAILEFVQQCTNFPTPFQCITDVRNIVVKGQVPKEQVPAVSIYDVLQSGEWDRYEGIGILRKMKLNTIATLCQQKKEAAVELTDSLVLNELVNEAQASVISAVMRHINAMTEADFLRPNNERLQELREQKATLERVLAQEKEKEKGCGGSKKAGSKEYQKPQVSKCYDGNESGNVLLVNLLYTAVPSAFALMPRVPYIKKKLDSLQLNKVHKDRLFRACVGACMTQVSVLCHYGLLVLSDNTRNSRNMIIFCGPQAMLNYVFLDLGYNYGSDFLVNRVGKIRGISRWLSLLRNCESRARRRFKYYDYLKRELGVTMKMLVSLYGACAYIDVV